MTAREDVRRLVDNLPEDELPAARRYLEYLRELGDPILRALRDAPEDDEPETDEERAEVEEAKAEIRRGEGRSWDEVRRELGRA